MGRVHIAMNKILALSEKIFTVISFIHYSGGPLFVILSGGVSEGEDGDDANFFIINQIFLVIYTISFRPGVLVSVPTFLSLNAEFLGNSYSLGI